MRTSRLSRETSRIISALSSRTRPTRQMSRATGTQSPAIDDAQRESSNEVQGASDLGSEFSDEPSDLEGENESVSSTSKTTQKRKRESVSSLKRVASRMSATPQKATGRQNARPLTSSEVASSLRTKKARRQPAKKITNSSGEVKIEPPANWEEMYSLTREMRSKVIAPVDTMGCESLADTTRPPRDQRLQTLVSLMLSSQTKDTVTAVAIRNLQQGIPGGFNLEGLLKLPAEDLNEMIIKVGFHNNKTKFIKQAAEILRDKFNGDIPDTIEGLTSLPGVGPKMAYLCMSAAWGRDEGIGVDVHVHRISNLWGWHNTKNPEETRAALEAWLPRDKWHDINNLLVGFGQTICLPVGRKCGECSLSDKGLCPGAVVQKVVQKRIKREVVEDEEGIEINEEVDEAVTNIKAEDVEDDVKMEIPDIEDIGSSKPRRHRPK